MTYLGLIVNLRSRVHERKHLISPSARRHEEDRNEGIWQVVEVDDLVRPLIVLASLRVQRTVFVGVVGVARWVIPGEIGIL